jgi:hypothetical protein
MNTLKNIVVYFFACIGFAFIVIATYDTLVPAANVKVYNCDIAEISPDFPVEVRNECRKLRIGKSITT